jgi:hypothetical protein
MSIAPKKGVCIDCRPNAEPRYIMAKRCITDDFHYQKHQQEKYAASKLKKDKARSAAVKQSGGQTLGNWFNTQINLMPKECENCKEYLNPYAPWSSRAYIAHIVPKRFFKSVQVHPMNRVFLCIDCHAKFDNSLSIEVEVMPVFPIAVARFKMIKNDIDSDEIHHLSPCFEKIYYGL